MADDNSNPSQDEEDCITSFIDLEMVPAKLTFICADGLSGSVVPFFNIFYISLGLSATQAGLITGGSYAVSSLAGPLWSCLADSSGRRKLIFVILCLGTATMFTMPFVAQAVGSYECTVEYNVTSDNVSTLSTPNVCYSTYHLLNPNVMFYTMLSFTIFSSSFLVSLLNSIDAIVINVVKTREKRTSYGEQKVFGPIGFGATNLLAGVIIDHYKPDNLSRYAAAFYVFLPCTFFLIPLGYTLLGQAHWNVEEEDDEERIGGGGERDVISATTKDVASHLVPLLKKCDTIVFLFTVMVTGMSYSVLMNFSFLLMDEMNSSKTVMTLIIVGSMVTEVIGYPLSSIAMKLVGGPIPVITMGVLSYSLRFLIMSYVKVPWLMIPVQILHIFGQPLAWSAELEYMYQISPKSITMTTINIVASIQYVASRAVANLVGGVVYHRYGGRVLFQACAVISGIWGMVMVANYGIKHYRKKEVSVHRSGVGSSHNKDGKP